MNHSLLTGALVGTLSAVALAQANPAQAFTLKINPNTSFSSNSPHTGASGDLDFTFSQVGNQVRLNLGVANTTNLNTSDGAGATISRLVGVAFDLPSLVQSYIFEQKDNASSPLRRLFGEQSLTSQTVQGSAALSPFSNNPPAGYPGGNFDVGIRSGGSGGGFNGGNPTGGLAEDTATAISFLLTTKSTAKQVEGAFYWGFNNVGGTNTYGAEPLRAALRFQAVDGDLDYDGETSDKLLAKPEAIPTPALLPALLAFGAGVFRKKKQEQAQEA